MGRVACRPGSEGGVGMSKSLSPSQIVAAGTLHEKNPGFYTWAMLGQIFGFNAETVRRACDPNFRERRREQNRKAWEKLSTKGGVKLDRIAAKNVRELQKQIPPDTRDLTGRLLGDPIPGDRRRQQFEEKPARICLDGRADRRFKTISEGLQ